MLSMAPAQTLLPYVVERQAGYWLRRAHQRHTALFQEAMATLDLTPTQFTALLKIVELGRTTQNLLGRLAAMDPATIQGVVRRLVARGLLHTANDPLDRRTVVLMPTPAGRDLAAAAIPIARDITTSTLQPLDEHEQGVFLALLARLA